MGSCGFTFLEDKETRKCLILLHFRAPMDVETVGVEDGSQAETRSPRGLRDFISVGGTLGGTLLHSISLRKECSPCAFPSLLNDILLSRRMMKSAISVYLRKSINAFTFSIFAFRGTSIRFPV